MSSPCSPRSWADQLAREWIQQAGGHLNADDVVDEREEPVLADTPHRRAAQASRTDDAAKIAFTGMMRTLSIATSVPVSIAILQVHREDVSSTSAVGIGPDGVSCFERLPRRHSACRR